MAKESFLNASASKAAAAVNASMNASGNATGNAQPVLANLSWPAFWIIITAILVVGVIIVILILKPRQAKSPTTRPLLRAILLTLLATVFIIVTEGLGWYGEDGMPYWMKAGFIFAVFFMALYLPKSDAQKMQERTQRIFPERIREHHREHYFSELNVGDSSGSQIPHYRVLPNNERYGAGDDHVVHYLVFDNRNRNYLYTFGLRTEILLETVEDPLPEHLNRIFKKAIKPTIPVTTIHRVEDASKRIGGGNSAQATPATN